MRERSGAVEFAGLSVPDPRERPEEAKEAAAAAHKVFADPDSDFLSLLNLWRTAPDAGVILRL